MDGSAVGKNSYAPPGLEGEHRTARVSIDTGHSFTAVVRPTESITKSLARGEYPAEYNELLGLLRKLAPPGARVLDLGGHVGTFSLGAAAFGYEVLAVEASPRNAASLEASRVRSGLDRLRVVHAAISDKPGTLRFCCMGPFGHVGRDGEVAGEEVVSVPALRVDDLLDELGYHDVAFVKMDIEGSEVAAIGGMKRLMDAPHAPAVFYECNGHTLNFFGQTPQKLKQAFAKRGYRSYRLEDDRLVAVRPGDFQPDTCVDYLAVKELPAALRTWRIDPPISQDEVVAETMRAMGTRSVPERSYLARALGRAPLSLRINSCVVQAITDLRNDPDPAVREAVAAMPLSSRVAAWAASKALGERRLWRS